MRLTDKEIKEHVEVLVNSVNRNDDVRAVRHLVPLASHVLSCLGSIAASLEARECRETTSGRPRHLV